MKIPGIILLLLGISLNAFTQTDPYLIKDFRKVNSEVLSLAYFPDGKTLLAGFNDGSAKIIDLENDAIKLSVKDHWQGVVAVDTEPEGRFFITAGDNTVKVWTIDGVLVHNMKDQTSTLWSAHLDKSGRYLVTGAISRIFKLFDVIEGKKLTDYTDHKDVVMAVRFSPDGKLIASASPGMLRIRDMETGEVISALPSHPEDIYSLAFCPDGKILASASKDKTVRLYNLEKNEQLAELKGHLNYVMDVEFSPCGNYLLSCSFDQTIRLWEISTGKTLYTFIDHKLQVTDICFSPDGKSFASASMDKTIKIWTLSPEIFVDFYYRQEIANELNQFPEFLPRQKGENKTDYDKRIFKRKVIRDDVYGRYYQRYLEEQGLGR